MRSRRVWRETIVASAGRSSRAVTISDQPFLFVIPAEPRQRREPESIITASGYGFRARGLRPRPGMTSRNLRGFVLVVAGLARELVVPVQPFRLFGQRGPIGRDLSERLSEPLIGGALGALLRHNCPAAIVIGPRVHHGSSHSIRMPWAACRSIAMQRILVRSALAGFLSRTGGEKIAAAEFCC